MKVYCATNIGCVRTLNEDSYYMPVDGQEFMAVADGMGGHRAGEIASRMAVRIFSEILQQEKAPSPERLRYAFNKANRDVYLESERDSAKRGMGTTMTGLWFGESDVLLGHVGDSRAYRLRNGKIERLSNVGSMITEPGFRSPRLSASSSIARAILSFTLPAGFRYSSLARIVASSPCAFS